MFDIPPDLIRPLIVSGVMTTALLVLRWLIARLIWRQKESLSADERRVLAFSKSVTVFLIILGLAFIWSPALSNFALSITAFAVAIVLATKELILCVSGATWRAITQPFSIGDWVEINHERGEVLEMNLLSTDLAELSGEDGTFTGKTLTIPNSLLLTSTVRNANLWRRYTHHTFNLVADFSFDARKIDAELSERVAERCAEFRPTAERYLSAMKRKIGVELPPAEPRVNIETTGDGRLLFKVHIFCPVERCEPLQQSLTHDFIALLKGQADCQPPGGDHAS